MSNLVKNTDSMFENLFLYGLMCGCISEHAALNRLGYFKLDNMCENVQVSLIRYDVCGQLKYKIVQIISDELKKCPFFRLMEDSAGICIISSAGCETAVFSAFSAVKKICGKSLNVLWAVGNSVPSVLKICHSYKNALHILRQAPLIGCQNGILTHTDIQKTVLNAVHYPICAEQELIHAVLSGKLELWQSLLINIILENNNKNPHAAVLLAQAFIQTVYRMLAEFGENPESVFGKNKTLFLHISDCSSYEELYAHIKKVFVFITETSSDNKLPKNSFLIKQMENFIYKNYMNHIGLNDLSEAVHLSPNYVSAVFKDGFGESFKSYLNRCRYEAACKAIRESPGKKLKQVALECGCNTDILTRIFFKYGGILPSDFQERIKRSQG